MLLGVPNVPFPFQDTLHVLSCLLGLLEAMSISLTPPVLDDVDSFEEYSLVFCGVGLSWDLSDVFGMMSWGHGL